MGRFYQTSKPQFLNDIMYQPPWQLAQQALASKQQGFDNALQSTDLVRNLLNVQHLDFEDDRVKNVKEYYNDQIDDLANQIAQNPNDYNKLLPSIRSLSREIDTDRREGNIAQIERRHADWQSWVKDNQDIKKEDPALFNRLAAKWYEDIKTDSSEDIGAKFKGVKGIARPDLNSTDMREALKQFKANATEVSNGRYKIGNKWLSEEEVQQAAYDIYMSDPNVAGYVNQMSDILKDPGFVDETGERRQIYHLVDKQGNAITPEEAQQLKMKWDNLPDEEKTKQGLPFSRQLNMQHSLAQGFRGFGDIFGFREQTLEEDKYGLESQKQANRRQLQAQKDAEAFKRLAFSKKADLNKLAFSFGQKGELEREKLKARLEDDALRGDEGATKALETIFAKESLGLIENASNSYLEDYDNVVNKRLPSQIPQDGKTYFSATPGTAAFQENYRLTQATKFAKEQVGNNPTAQEYFEYLGDRRPSEETAKEFLEKKGVFQKPEFASSIAEAAANNARWTPDFLKGEAAEEWDKIYDIGKQYEESVNKWYEDEGSKSIQVSVNPLSLPGKVMIKNELNSQSGEVNYFTTDEDGNPLSNIEEEVKVKEVLGVTGGNNQSNIGFQVLTEDDEIKWMFPAITNDNAKQLSRNLSLMSVKDKNSAFAKEVMDQEVNRITTEINKGIDVNGTKSNIINIAGSQLVIKTTPEGKIEVYDQDGNEKAGTWNNVNHLVEYIYR